MDALSIASVFVGEFVSRFGAPESLHTDQGRNFDSKLFKDVCTLLGIKKTRTTAYHPAGDGLIERFNQTLERLLSHYVDQNQRNWDVQLPAVLMAYRTTEQSSTGYTPAYLLFGRELCLPQDVAHGLPRAEGVTEPAHAKSLRERLAEAHATVRDRLRAVHQHQADLYDAGAKPVSFEIGDLVWLLVPAVPVGTAPKLAKLWKGPFTIVNRLSQVVYRIRDTAGAAKLQIVHVNRLKRCRVRPDHLLPAVGEDVTDSTDLQSLTTADDSAGSGSYEPDATDELYSADDDGIRAETYDGLDVPPAAPVDLPDAPVAAPGGRPVQDRQPPRYLADYHVG